MSIICKIIGHEYKRFKKQDLIPMYEYECVRCGREPNFQTMKVEGDIEVERLDD